MVEYSDALIDQICERLAAGESLVSICRDENMPCRAAVHKWLKEDRGGFMDKYARAREDQADVLAEEIIEIADDARNDWMERNGEDSAGWAVNGEHIQRSRLRIDARKWYAGKLRPKVYGDRVDHEHKGTINVLIAPEHDGI